MSVIRRSNVDKRIWQEWLELCNRIEQSTVVAVQETDDEKEIRKKKLTKNFVKFARYYFPHYIDADFGWFHKKAAKLIERDPNIFAILEWPREHAKSVFINVMMAMYLYARGELTGMVVVSANQEKAITLLADIQAEFKSNQRWKNDYGELARMGDWREGAFSTVDGMGFWAFGRGQSPRGIRKAAKRPNYAVIDDIDDKIIVINQDRVRKIRDWIIEDLYGALSIKGGSRLIVAGNRIHRESILAHMVGDVEQGDPKRPGITHLKVYAFENPKTHRKSDEIHGKPAWKERYTKKMLLDKMVRMGYRSSRREYFHEHHEEGFIFQNEWFTWIRPLNFENYDDLNVYCDPSFKHTKSSDYKAIILQGRRGNYIDVLDVWIRKTTIAAMVRAFYDLYDKLGSHARYFMEANMLQDLLLDEFDAEGKARGYDIPLRPDKRTKPNKVIRIENLSPFYERGLIRFNERIRKSPDTQLFIQQLLGFPYGHDDGPDAQEGGIYYLQRGGRRSNFKSRAGRFKFKNSKWTT